MTNHLPEHLESLIGCDGEMHCLRCGLVLLVTDRVCPVCDHDHEMQVAMHAKLRAILTAAQAVTSLYSGGAGADINSSTGNSYMDDLLQSLLEALADG